MKKKSAGILLGMTIFSVALSGCTKNEATEAVNESVTTEKEGNGESEEVQNTSEDQNKDEGDEAATEEQDVQPSEKVGVLLPSTAEDDRWSLDSSEIQKTLKDDGYEGEIRYAENDVNHQISQIRELVQEEVSALIIAPVDEYSLTEELAQAKEKGIPVFSYDSLIRDTDAVNYYTTFDTRKTGQDLGNNIVERMNLKKAREDKTSYTIEFLMGSPDDNSALFIYNGMMQVLQEYLDDGTLVCKSEKTSFDDTALMRWSVNTAQNYMADILNEFYDDEESPDIICTAYDGLAFAAEDALQADNIQPGTEAWPFITGIGCEKEAVIDIAEGKMAFSIFLDNRNLAQECVRMVDTYLKGEKPEVNDYEQYDNGVKIIGTHACEGQIIDKDNYQVMFDNGYYPEDEIRPLIQPSNTPTPAETPDPTETPELTENPESTETSEPSGTPAPTEASEPSGPPAPTEASQPSGTPVPTETQAPIQTPKTTNI